MEGMNAGTAVAGRNSSVFARMRRAGTGGTRTALLTLSAVMALAGGRATCADTYVDAWGLNTEGQCNTPVFPLAKPVAAISGAETTPSRSQLMATSSAGERTTGGNATRHRPSMSLGQLMLEANTRSCCASTAPSSVGDATTTAWPTHRRV